VSGPDGAQPAIRRPEVVWTEEDWRRLQQRAAAVLLRCPDVRPARGAVAHLARKVMRRYTSSFHLVTRFLPGDKRRDVELIYANVRYPDEVVDTFPLSSDERLERLDRWGSAYERALVAASPRDAVEAGAPALLACFAELVRDHCIPPEHYRAFLAAMRADVAPRRYADMQALIDGYVYGSAVVVGYLLAHAFGPARPDTFGTAIEAARELGIGLQMTNFLRDVAEDLGRGRVYLPMDRLAEVGITEPDPANPDHRTALGCLVIRMARENDARYEAAQRGLPAFAPDVRSAVEACIRVYRLLNDRLAGSGGDIGERVQVPLRDKWRALPPSKVWVLPLAYLARR